jgi:hypothetical protein
MVDDAELATLVGFVGRVPSVFGTIGKGRFADGRWWVVFTIDAAHVLAWRVVQEFAHVLNYRSMDGGRPLVFMPVFPPSHVNGDPRDSLGWVIESKDVAFSAKTCREWLEGRLPRPVDDPASWAEHADL